MLASYSKVPLEGEFMRKGIVRDHKNEMTSNMINRFDDWIEANVRNTDYTI